METPQFADIQTCLTLSQIVYLSDIHAETETLAEGFSSVTHVGNGGPHAMVCESETDVFVVVRGTERDDWKDLVADGRAWPEPSGVGGRVHKGIYLHALQLTPLLELVQTTTKRLTFTGHSLGGAAACHLAFKAGQFRTAHDLALPHLVLIGSPRIGTRKFCHAVSKHSASVTRLINHRDVVPLCIPGYFHPPGKVLHCNRFGLWVTNPTWRQRFEDRAKGWAGSLTAALWAVVTHLFPLESHAIDTYGRQWSRRVDV